MVTRIFQLLLLLSPIAIGADINMDIFDLIFFRTGVVVLFIASLLDTPKRELPIPLKHILVGLLGLCLFNVFNHSFHQVVLLNTLNCFLSVVGFCVIYTYYDEKKSLSKFILAAALINLIFFVFQRFGFDPVFDKSNHIIGGGAFLGNTPRLTNYFTLVTPFMPFYLLPLSIIFGIAVKQYSILIAVFVVLLGKFRLLKTRIVIFSALVLFLFLIREHFIASVTVRFNDAWYPVLKAFFDRPLIGCGLGINPVPGSNLGVILNSYIQFIVGVGILGVVWFGYIFKVIHRKLVLIRQNIPFIVLLLLMLVEYPIEMMRLWFLIMAIIVIFVLNNFKQRSLI